MRMKITNWTVCILAVVLVAATATAQETGSGEIQELRSYLLEIKQQMEEMEKRHEEEIQDLKNEIENLKKMGPTVEEEKREDEAAFLRQLAESMAGEKKQVEQKPEETVFKYSGLSLQTLNPEISASVDMLAHYTDQKETRQRTDAEIRGVELNVQSYLDPFSRMKATMHVSDEGVDVEEAYMTRFSVFEGANLDLGRFRQQFGVVNRWHEDALDQVQYPLVLRNIFGNEGLNQTGASLDLSLPDWGKAYQNLTLQVTNTENERLFGGDTLGTPSMLFHYKNYRDLDEETYLEFGLSGLFGWSDEWDVMRGGSLVKEYDALGTQVYGADLSVVWEPPGEALYRNLEWRSELYLLNRNLLAPDGSGRDTLSTWGAYSYLQAKVARELAIGMRGDWYEPDTKDYAAVSNASLSPLAVTESGAYRWQLAPYLTWWQSEFVKYRFEYDYSDGKGLENAAHTVWFQALFSVGPHKHERY